MPVPRGRVTALGVGCVTGQDRVTKDKLSITGRRVCVKVPPHTHTPWPSEGVGCSCPIWINITEPRPAVSKLSLCLAPVHGTGVPHWGLSDRSQGCPGGSSL